MFGTGLGSQLGQNELEELLGCALHVAHEYAAQQAKRLAEFLRRFFAHARVQGALVAEQIEQLPVLVKIDETRVTSRVFGHFVMSRFVRKLK